MPESASIQLTHDEIWDDSALINSWNDALEEYKKYHSIAAKGGSLDDVPTQKTPKIQDGPPVVSEGAQVDANSEPAESEPPAVASPQAAPPAPPVQVMLGSIKDENMKKLLMSWYYAGYYTGLYEGQQQAGQAS